jgi:uroporphyrinogen-III decarboxylase
MQRSFYLDLAASGLRMPIGTHLILHEEADPAAVVTDGRRLGEVVARAAARFATPLAFPLMDLTLEKEALALAFGVPAAATEAFHFDRLPEEEPEFELTPRMRVTAEAIAHVAARPGLVPVGMSIGAFSLMTKLVADPITPVYLAGSGLDGDEETEVAMIERILELATRLVLQSISAQIEAGARAIIVCEPAANLVYFSPIQLAQSHAHFERYVMRPMGRIKELLLLHGVDLIFHDCGELTTGMVERFAGLDAAMLSFGSSRMLWEDAGLVPNTTVLYGNLPTKRFVSSQLTVAEVERLAAELLEKMRATGHPFILGSECDVLSVPGSGREILAKVEAFLDKSRIS